MLMNDCVCWWYLIVWCECECFDGECGVCCVVCGVCDVNDGGGDVCDVCECVWWGVDVVGMCVNVMCVCCCLCCGVGGEEGVVWDWILRSVWCVCGWRLCDGGGFYGVVVLKVCVF